MRWLSWFQQERKGPDTSVRGSGQPAENNVLAGEGHRFVNDSSYVMPNDVQETNRLDFQHYLMRHVLQRNYLAPLGNPKGILDVGCGTGRWAQELASAYPRSKVFGLDIVDSVIRRGDTAPANFRFIQGDILKELPFPDMTFDFVHQRFLHAAIPAPSWPGAVQELVRVTRLGGWIEIAESDLVAHNQGPAMQRFSRWALELIRERGINPQVSTQIGVLLQRTGCVNMQMYKVNVPIGKWGGRIGVMSAADMQAFCFALKPGVLRRFGLTPQQFDFEVAAVMREWEENHSYFSFYIAYAQRAL